LHISENAFPANNAATNKMGERNQGIFRAVTGSTCCEYVLLQVILYLQKFQKINKFQEFRFSLDFRYWEKLSNNQFIGNWT